MPRWLFTDWFTASELDEVDRRLELHRKRQTETRRNISAQETRIAELERNLGRVALLSRALAEACLQAGVLNLDALKAKIVEVDLADGVEDGRLDPRVALPGEAMLANLEPIRERDGPSDRGNTGMQGH